MNKLYKIYRKDEIDYEETSSFVISGPNTVLVRLIASENAGCEGNAIWKNPKYTKIKYLGKTTVKYGVLSQK